MRRCGLLIALGVSLPSRLDAAPKNPAATKLANEAMFKDYRSLRFVDAHSKLERAVKLCGPDECSPRVVARLHRDLGVVLIAGFGDAARGRNEFSQALKADPTIALDRELLTPEIERAFRLAGGAGETASPAAAPPDLASTRPAAARPRDEGLLHTPPTEQATLTPVPLYVELDVDSESSKVVVQYKAYGATEWKKLDLGRTEGGFGGEIPCSEVGSATGDLLYYLYALDRSGDLVAKSGSRVAPHRVAIRNRISGAAPHLPGRPAPSRCSDAGDCPPDFPGCLRDAKGDATSVERTSRANKSMAAGKSWGDGCSSDSECGPGLACKAGQCDTGAKAVDAADASSSSACESSADCAKGETCGAEGFCVAPAIARKRLWLSLHVAQDVSIVGNASNVCGTTGDAVPSNMLCLTGAGDAYGGVPLAGAPGDGNGNAIRSGPHLGTTRLLAGIDYALGANVMVGARVGYAFNSAPRDDPPLHLEARASYVLGQDPFRKTTVREYLALLGGRAEIDDKYDVQVRSPAGATDDLVVYRATGKYFGGAALGLMFPLGPKQALVAESKFIATFPTRGYAIAPSVGYAF